MCCYAGKAPTVRRSGLSRLRGKLGREAKKMAIDECRSLYEGTKIYGDCVKAFLVEIPKTKKPLAILFLGRPSPQRVITSLPCRGSCSACGSFTSGSASNSKHVHQKNKLERMNWHLACPMRSAAIQGPRRVGLRPDTFERVPTIVLHRPLPRSAGIALPLGKISPIFRRLIRTPLLPFVTIAQQVR